MNANSPSPTMTPNACNTPDFNGAALIDAQGREIPITEEMIQNACARLEAMAIYPRFSQPVSSAH